MDNLLSAVDLSRFWKDSDYARKEHIAPPITAEQVQDIERELGYTFPRAYVELAQHQNGGIPNNTNHHTKEPTSWAEDHVAITSIFAISREGNYSLCGDLGSRFWIDEWGYPAIGVYFADCPSAGHDMLCLDYRKCGPDGEPAVVHIDQEQDYKITFVAESFAAFIRQLEPDEAFELD